jgi:hypothetical protein
VPAVGPNPQTLELLVSRLHESHEASVYDAIERLVLVAETVGLSANVLVCMLDGGMRLEELIEVIEAQIESLHRASVSAVESKAAA